jgi:hypothetical protein
VANPVAVLLTVVEHDKMSKGLLRRDHGRVSSAGMTMNRFPILQTPLCLEVVELKDLENR